MGVPDEEYARKNLPQVNQEGGENAEFENPFATRYTRPGAMAYLFPGGESAEGLVERLLQNDGWGQIVGPHGVGKSTLLATLVPRLEAAGRHVYSLTLHNGQRRLPRSIMARWSWAEQALIVVDGYEQLSYLSRFLLKRRCRRNGAGLLVTAHADVGLPWLDTLFANRELVERLVQRLLNTGSPSFEVRSGPTDEEMSDLLAKHGDDIRELLFDLYNRYERQTR